MQEQLTAAAIALAFNTQNTRKVWSARANSRETTERVHFSTESGMVKLVYDCKDRTFTVQFTKVHAAWGDYVRAIARAMHVVLTTLKSGGLPFDAPDGDEGIVIRATTGAGGAITVAYEPPLTPETAIMPELRFTSNAQQVMTQMRNAAPEMQKMHDDLIAAGARWDGMDGYDFSTPPADDDVPLFGSERYEK